MSTLLDPRIIDASTLSPRATSPIYLPIAVEGQADVVGTAVAATPYTITRVDEANTYFGPASSLARTIKAVLDRGAGPVIGIASVKSATLPTLVERQAAWAKLESDPLIRIRLTDAEVQATISKLAASCANADLLYNKQIAIVGLPTATDKTAMIAGASAISAEGVTAATRACLVGPGVYDDAGTLRGGSFAAACVAAEVAKNADPTNDLDIWDLPRLTGIERSADTLPVFTRRVVGGTAINDFEDLLQGGVSVLQPSRVPGGVSTTHLRTAYVTNTSYDNLYTRVIVDQLFVDVKNYLFDSNFLRSPNTDKTRMRIASGVETLLRDRGEWVRGVTQANGEIGYNVSITPSADYRQITVGYEGVLQRGTNTIKVAANLSIPV